VVAALVATLAPVGHVAAAPVDTETADVGITDPGLAEAVADAAPAERITVEIATDDTAGARQDALAVGGIVTGSVPGEVLQVSLPAARVDDLAAEVPAVRLPLVANRPVRRAEVNANAPEFGPVTGQNIAVVKADAWHAAGLTGAGVKVGIVDFFDLSRWNPAGQGPLPDGSHRLCVDTTGSGYCTPHAPEDGEEHGVAVAEIVRDMAPGAELYLATVGSASDLLTAINWFSVNGVAIITRSLGAAYDGPGDGTGPLAAVVDAAAAKGITWFNSGGNDAAGSYGRFTDGVDASGYVDFLPGPGVDTGLAVFPNSSGCIGLDGVRWSDWGKAAAQTTDYALEVWDATNTVLLRTIDARQTNGAVPLEGVDEFECPTPTRTLRIRRVATGGDPSADVVEVGLFAGDLEHSQAAYSAAKPVVDSRSPALVAVGAIDPPAGSQIGSYSSQGPTNDGRTKPDMSTPSGVRSSIYVGGFSGTSAASPTAAGMAALLYGRGLAGGGAPLAALTKHLVVDLGTPGADNAFGAGRALLPTPPAAALDSRPATFAALATPVRLLDTRAGTATANAPIGPHAPFTIIDLPVGVSGATAVALSIVSTDTSVPGYVQAYPTMMAAVASSSTLNVATVGQVQPNFAIVPVGSNNSVSLYLFAGGNVVVDLLGTFTPAATATATAGRFVAVDPVRVLDTRPESNGPVPPGWVAHQPAAGETVRVTGIPAGASAAVVNVAADQAVGPGFLRTQATGATGLTTSNGNYVAGLASGTMSIVPVGADGTISVFTSNATHLIVDLMGYVTGPTAPAAKDGLFVPLTPRRIFDTRDANAPVLASLATRAVPVVGSSAPVPAGATAVSFNVTSDAAVGAGYATIFPADRNVPLISNLNYPAVDPRANAGMVRLSAGGGLTVLTNQTTHVIIDVNGYFTGPT
jgi:hypothetical protein